MGSGDLGEKSIEIEASFLDYYGFEETEPIEEPWKERDGVRRDG